MVWVLFQNMINAPATTETMARRNARIRKHGKKMHSALVFRLEKRWSPKKLSMARQKNRLIQKKSAALIAKHGLTAIFYGNSKLGPEALAERKGLGKAFARYQKERRALIRSIVSLPQFHSQHYSLWLIGTTGASGQFALIYPHAVSAQNYAIRNLLPKILTPAK
ncbi:hypothetical protein KKF84_15025, partial [Myxococcota bacterium]|nr:hypothetical protein [Myxococcota bacterium]